MTVHNLGASPAKEVAVSVRARQGVVTTKRIPEVGAPLDLKPRTAQVTFTGLKSAMGIRVMVDADDAIPELNELNNAAPAPERRTR